MMKQKIVGKAVQTVQQANVWKCVSFLLIGVIGGYLLSPCKGGVLIGSYNGSRIKMPPQPGMPPMPPHHGRHRPKKPHGDGIVIGSFNRCVEESAEEVCKP